MYVGLENTIKGAGTLLHLFSAKSESISSAPKSTHLHLSANSVIFPLLLAVINSRTLQWALLLLWLHYFYKIDYSPLTQRQFAQKNYWWLKPRYTCQNKLLEYLLRGSSPSSSGRLSATVICTAWGLEVGRQCWWRPCDAMWQLCSTGGCVGVIWNLVFPCTLPMLHQMCAQSNFVDRGGWFAIGCRAQVPQDCLQSMWCLWVCTWMQESAGSWMEMWGAPWWLWDEGAQKGFYFHQ